VYGGVSMTREQSFTPFCWDQRRRPPQLRTVALGASACKKPCSGASAEEKGFIPRDAMMACSLLLVLKMHVAMEKKTKIADALYNAGPELWDPGSSLNWKYA
jgi:hypothetical protein